MTIENAKLLANQYAETGVACAFIGKYTDGVVYYLCCTAQTQRKLYKRFNGCIAQGRSDDDSCGVIITNRESDVENSLWLESEFSFDQIESRNCQFFDDHTIELHCKAIRNSAAMKLGGEA